MVLRYEVADYNIFKRVENVHHLNNIPQILEITTLTN